MQGKRGGRVQVNMMQYMELVARVEKLETMIGKNVVEESNPELTKKEIVKLLDKKGIEYNIRDKKDILIKLLEE